MIRRFAGVLLVALMLPVSAMAQTAVSWDTALFQQLTTNGVADPANATGEELAAAVQTLMANNPSLLASDVELLVTAAVRRNPAAYQAIAVAASRQATQ